DHHHDGVSQLKGEDDPTVVAFRPAESLLEMRLKHRDGLPVNVVDGGGKEEQATNGPAQMGELEAGGARRKRRGCGRVVHVPQCDLSTGTFNGCRPRFAFFSEVSGPLSGHFDPTRPFGRLLAGLTTLRRMLQPSRSEEHTSEL